MAFTHGKDAVFWLDNGAGTLTNISAYVTSISFSRSADVAEVTTLGDGSKEYLAGLKDATISLEGKWDPTVDAILDAALGAASTKSFEYGPEGGSNGDVKYSGECLGTSYEPGGAGLDDAVGWTMELQVSGAITRGTFS